MLVPISELLPLLRSPSDGSPLEIDEQGTFVSVRGERIFMLGGKPVLIQFEDSVFEREQIEGASGRSAVERVQPGPLVNLYRRFASSGCDVSSANTTRFMELCRTVAPRPRILVVGGGTIGQGAGILYESPDVDVVAFDVYTSPHVHFIADAHHLPLADESFDGVYIQAVLEHVLEPHRVVEEVYRVLKPRGGVYAETPFMQQVHEGPYDFTRFTESGHRWLFHRFSRVDSGALSGPGVQLIWSLSYFTRGLFRSKLAGRVARLLCFWLRYADRLIPERYRIDGACGVYFLGTKGRGISPREIVGHYRGAG